MPLKKILRIFAPVLLLIALTLASMSCATCPPRPEPPPEPLPLAWPILAAPPDGIVLDEAGAVVVPLDYWTELVGYIRAVDDVRAALDREGRLVNGSK